MSIIDCVDVGVADGSISRETGRRVRDKFAEVSEDLGDRGRLSPHERDVRASQRVEKDLERDRLRRKRMRLLQASKQAELLNRVATAPAGTADKAAFSILEFDPSGRHVGNSVVSSHQALRGNAWAIAEDFIQTFRSRAGGFTRDTTELGAVLKGLFGEATTPQGMAAAKGLQEARDYLVRRFNAAGGDIKMLKNFGWTQRHDGDAIRAVGKEQWKAEITPLLDLSRMYDAAGEPMTLRGLTRMLDAAYDDITGIAPLSDAAGEFGSPVSKMVHHRNFVFADSVAWTQYQQKYGSGDILSAIIGDMDRLSRDTALLENLGPYPLASIRSLAAAIDRDRAASGVGEIGKHDFLQNLFDQVSGRAGLASNSRTADAFQSARNLITSARLGSAIFVSMADFGTARQVARFNGLPMTRVMAEYLQQLNPANAAHRKQAARLGYITESWLGDMVAVERMLGEVSGSAVTSKIADTSLRLTGLGAHTEGLRNAFKTVYVAHLTDQARFAWHSIDPTTRTAMQRYGIAEADWNLYRSTSIWTDPETRADFIRIEDIHRDFETVRISPDEREARRAAAAKFHNMISTEGRFAVVEPTARSRTFINAGTRAGTLPGEIVRSFAQFKAFTVAFTYMHGARGWAQDGAFNRIKYAAGLVIPMTLAGAFAEQMSSINRGQEPRDMTDPKFWASAVARGGSFGPLGDFLFGGVLAENRHGISIASQLAGPLVGQTELLAKAIAAASQGDNAANEFRRFAEGFLPGNSLWYTRLAVDRMIKDQLEDMLDPKAEGNWRRAERKTKKEFGTGMWWRRGEPLPQ
jgi:hypothetical protein